jgi:cholesterol transport system auxiliary component
MRRFAAMLAAALLPACAAFAPEEADMRSALLDKLPAEVPRARCAPAVLAVARPDARPVYDTAQMAYTLRPHQVAYFARHQWAETPGQMLHPLLVRTIERTGCFGVVLAQPGAGATHTLRADIVELVQDFTQEPPVLRLGLRVRLDVVGSTRPPVQRDVTVTEAMRQKDPLAGVDSANDAVARALEQTAAFVLEQMR